MPDKRIIYRRELNSSTNKPGGFVLFSGPLFNDPYIQSHLDITIVDDPPDTKHPYIFVFRFRPYKIKEHLKSTNIYELLPDDILKDFIDEKAIPIIDETQEGYVYDEEFWQELYKQTEECGGNCENLFFISSNAMLPNMHDWYTKKNNLSKKINVFSYSYFNAKVRKWIINNTYETCDLSHNMRKKHYTCLNNRPRPHRMVLLSHMLQSNLSDKGYYSFVKVSKGYWGSECSEEGSHGGKRSWNPMLSGNKESMNKYRKKLDIIWDRLPMMVDITVNDRGRFGGDYDASCGASWPYRNSYFSIVPETHFRSGEATFLSEKTFKPIVQYHPFIIVGDPGSLKELHRLGYKTFHPHIDESYDEILDPEARMNAIFEQIKRLCNMSIHEIHDWYFNMFDIIEYNRDHIYGENSYSPLKNEFEQIYHKLEGFK